MKTVVSKKSLRELTRKRRLPSRFEMFVFGAWLYDLLKANNIDIKLWHMSYWLKVRSLNRRKSEISFEPQGEGAR
jgi:hypothetical protein